MRARLFDRAVRWLLLKSARRGIRSATVHGWTVDQARAAWIEYIAGIAEDAARRAP